ncbi:hypothetical protein LVISKB_0914 [Levilactobacillus brevis KB290]|uniref:Uncharacterized protein n=1 Tax=Levilactobacillus brevis KB290 TaxID=1001583 RepID=M5ACQ4_LEVBR|nr:hypothetical protein LVISKB_0914 [Levilactobacillus brevis KB290]
MKNKIKQATYHFNAVSCLFLNVFMLMDFHKMGELRDNLTR